MSLNKLFDFRLEGLGAKIAADEMKCDVLTAGSITLSDAYGRMTSNAVALAAVTQYPAFGVVPTDNTSNTLAPIYTAQPKGVQVANTGTYRYALSYGGAPVLASVMYLGVSVNANPIVWNRASVSAGAGANIALNSGGYVECFAGDIVEPVVSASVAGQTANIAHWSLMLEQVR